MVASRNLPRRLPKSHKELRWITLPDQHHHIITTSNHQQRFTSLRIIMIVKICRDICLWWNPLGIMRHGWETNSVRPNSVQIPNYVYWCRCRLYISVLCRLVYLTRDSQQVPSPSIRIPLYPLLPIAHGSRYAPLFASISQRDFCIIQKSHVQQELITISHDRSTFYFLGHFMPVSTHTDIFLQSVSHTGEEIGGKQRCGINSSLPAVPEA